jgi:hypothetical protein
MSRPFITADGIEIAGDLLKGDRFNNKIAYKGEVLATKVDTTANTVLISANTQLIIDTSSGLQNQIDIINSEIVINDGTDGVAAANALGAYSISIGYGSNSANNNSVSIGRSAGADGDHGISIGHLSSFSDNDGISIGRQSIGSGVGGVTIGSFSKTSSDYNIALGYGGIAQNSNSAIITAAGNIDSTTHLDNTIHIGSLNGIQDLFVSGDIIVGGAVPMPGIVDSTGSTALAANTIYFLGGDGTAHMGGFTPQVGQQIIIIDKDNVFATRPVTIPNITFEGIVNTDLLLNISNTETKLIYINSTYGWKAIVTQ